MVGCVVVTCVTSLFDPQGGGLQVVRGVGCMSSRVRFAEQQAQKSNMCNKYFAGTVGVHRMPNTFQPSPPSLADPGGV